MVKNYLGKLALTPLVVLGWIYALGPDFFRTALAGGFAFIPRLLKMRHSVVEQNLKYAFPGDTSEAQKKREDLKHASDRHLAHLFFEVCMVLSPFSAMPFFIKHRTRVVGFENWQQANEKNKGVLFLSSHVGCWEVMAAQGAMAGIPAVIVTKRLKPAWFHDWIEKGRARCGVHGAYEPKTLSVVLKHLKNHGTVGFVLDQYAGPPIGVRVPLFGIPVGTANVVATLAKRTGIPVIPAVNVRTKGGRFMLEIFPEVAWKTGRPDEELALNTAHYVSILEQHILAHPDQWLWIHRRFKGDLSPLRKDEWLQPRLRRS